MKDFYKQQQKRPPATKEGVAEVEKGADENLKAVAMVGRHCVTCLFLLLLLVHH